MCQEYHHEFIILFRILFKTVLNCAPDPLMVEEHRNPHLSGVLGVRGSSRVCGLSTPAVVMSSVDIML